MHKLLIIFFIFLNQGLLFGYSVVPDTDHSHNEFVEWNIYGSEAQGRFAVVKPKVKFAVNNSFNSTPPSQFSRVIGDKEYELKDHLGNVRVTVSDRKLSGSSNNFIVTSATSYLPFGMVEPGFFNNSGNHRYGYNGHEKDDEIAGEGNHLDFGGFGYDARVGRRMNREPLSAKYPSTGSYVIFNNNPIYYQDIDGLKAWGVTRQWNKEDLTKFGEYAKAKIQTLYEQKVKIDCADLGYQLIIGYAADNGLPLSLQTKGGQQYDSQSEKYSTEKQYLMSIKQNFGTNDIESNMSRVGMKEVSEGDADLIQAVKYNGNKVDWKHYVIYTDVEKNSIRYGNLNGGGPGEISRETGNWPRLSNGKVTDKKNNVLEYFIINGNEVLRWNVLMPDNNNNDNNSGGGQNEEE